MDVTINRYIREQLDGTELIKGHSSEWIQNHMKQIIELGLADRVEAVDANGTAMFQWPRTVSAA